MKPMLKCHPSSPFAGLAQLHHEAISVIQLVVRHSLLQQEVLASVTFVNGPGLLSWLDDQLVRTEHKSYVLCEQVKAYIQGMEFRGTVGLEARLRKKTVEAALKGIDVVHCQRRDESTQFLELLLESARKKKTSLTFLDGKSATGSVSLDGIRRQSKDLAKMLLTVRGLGLQKVKEVVKRYPTMLDLMRLFEEQGELALEQIQVGLATGSKRRLGKSVSQRLYRVFMTLDPEEPV